MYVCIATYRIFLGGGGANFRVKSEKTLRINLDFVTATQSKGAIWRKQYALAISHGKTSPLFCHQLVTVDLLFL